MLEFLLDHGMDPNIVAKRGRISIPGFPEPKLGAKDDLSEEIPVLQYAVREAWDVRCVELLLDAQADIGLCRFPFKKDPAARSNLLWTAAANPDVDPSVVELLLHARANLGEGFGVARRLYEHECRDERAGVKIWRELLAYSVDQGGHLTRVLLRLGMDAHRSLKVMLTYRDHKVGDCLGMDDRV